MIGLKICKTYENSVRQNSWTYFLLIFILFSCSNNLSFSLMQKVASQNNGIKLRYYISDIFTFTFKFQRYVESRNNIKKNFLLFSFLLFYHFLHDTACFQCFENDSMFLPLQPSTEWPGLLRLHPQKDLPFVFFYFKSRHGIVSRTNLAEQFKVLLE